ncbi:hypothetical protein [Mucilaginibacter sp. CSA2-8R]|uniref:hypothetical protein n=1 Tax=Mucilaginibacter sp. CSA2-8R TaxID=3141542 RepID=UPI00315C89FA
MTGKVDRKKRTAKSRKHLNIFPKKAMRRHVEKRGDLPLTFNYLLFSLEQYHTTYMMMLYSQMFFYKDISDVSSGQIPDKTVDYISFDHDNMEKHMNKEVEPNQDDIYTISLRDHAINLQLGRFQFISGKNFDDALDTINMQVGHQIRLSFINSIYETLDFYIGKYQEECDNLHKGGGKREHLKVTLRKQPWYIMLYILRNNVSHAHNLHKAFVKEKWLKTLPQNEFKWRTISVKVGMYGHQIRYDNKELSLLYNDMSKFIINNEDLFTKDVKGNILPGLLP